MSRTQPRRRSLSAAVIAAAAMLVLVSAAPPSDRILFRLAAADADRVPDGLAGDTFVVQNLGSVLLVVGPETAPETLAAAGVPAVVLERDLRGKAFFLVRTLRSGDEAVLDRLGTAVLLEDRTYLFRPAFGEPREILPSSFRLKRLDLDRAAAWPDRADVRHEGVPGESLIFPDPRVFEWVAQVSKTRLTETIQSLQNFQTRYASTVSCENSGAFLHDEFVRLGLACEYETFSFSSSNYQTRNIIATLPGKSIPGKVVIVCAHYDSYSNNPRNLAPGADDNASGTAAVLEIARILAGASLDYTVKFICFSAEEWGLYGARHYAQRAKSRGENIVGVINMDMIAFTDSANPILEVYVNSASDWLGDRYLEAAAVYAPLSVHKIRDSSATWSDHSPFWDQGFSALCAIEEAADRNPYYHRTSDTLDKLNMNYGTSVTRASLAAAADLARPFTVRPLPPTGLEARSQIVGSLFAGVKSVALAWDAGPAAVVGYNVYRTTVSGGGYVKLNAGLLGQPLFNETRLDPAVIFYYVVTAVDNQGRESDFSDEVRDDRNNDAYRN